MNKRHEWNASFAPLALAALLSLAGCQTGNRLVAGDTRDLDKAFGCYVSSGEDTYRKITEEDATLMLAGAVWSVDDGLILQDSSLGFILGSIYWFDDDAKHTVPRGVWITAQAKVGVAEDAGPGDKSIKVQLPSLPTVAQALGGTAMCAPLDYYPHGASEAVRYGAGVMAADPPAAYTSGEPLIVRTLSVHD